MSQSPECSMRQPELVAAASLGQSDVVSTRLWLGSQYPAGLPSQCFLPLRIAERARGTFSCWINCKDSEAGAMGDEQPQGSVIASDFTTPLPLQ